MLAAVAAAATIAPQRFLSVDARRRSVTLTLVAEYDGANNGFNFDGYGRGRMLVSVPLGWRIRIRCENRGTRPHSCAVVAGGAVAFAGASTPPLRTGRVSTFSFVASRRGTYRLASLAPGELQARMYDVLDVGKSRRVEISAR